jgi:hypothetical protein
MLRQVRAAQVDDNQGGIIQPTLCRVDCCTL